MAQIRLSQDDAKFLRDLQNELLTQPNDGNADPVYWGVMETREEPAPDGCGEPRIHLGDGVVCDITGAVDFVNENIQDYNDDVRLEWEEETDHNDEHEITDFISERLRMFADVVFVEERSRISRETGAFLTKRACQEYITQCGYNHSRPHTYAMTAYRNYELARLLKILKTMEIKED